MLFLLTPAWVPLAIGICDQIASNRKPGHRHMDPKRDIFCMVNIEKEPTNSIFMFSPLCSLALKPFYGQKRLDKRRLNREHQLTLMQALSKPRFTILQHTARYGWYIPIWQGTNTDNTSVRSHISCVGMLNMTQCSSAHTIPIAGWYIGTDR